MTLERALLEGQEDQSILISGVSGAGKTETAKLLLGHLASVAGSEEGGVGSERIQHMVECTVVLESFGNAVMVCTFFGISEQYLGGLLFYSTPESWSKFVGITRRSDRWHRWLQRDLGCLHSV